jgi:hypothetical protein
MVAVPDDFDARNDALLELAEDNHDDLLLLSQQPSADAELVNDEQMP